MMPTEQRARMDAVSNDRYGRIGSNRSLEAQIERLRARVVELERERDAAEGFAALAGHELMSPLVMAEACAAMAAERLDDGRDKDVLTALDSLARGASRTRRLIESLLHEASANGHPLRRDMVDLGQLAADCVAQLRPEIEARGAHVELGELPWVSGNTELLGGVFTNLLGNALKYNPRQGGRIRFSAEARDGDWAIFVDDDGPPIPADDRALIFEPFQRGRNERRAKGTGLGLAICQRVVERHGGQISVVERPDGGNRFFFTLPAT
jgi:signal transduction histidine kinase